MGQESKIEKAVCRHARAKGCYVRKFTSPSSAGVPDDYFLTPAGLSFFIEFKAPGEEPRAMQVREMREINRRNGRAYWVDNIPDGITLVDNMLKVGMGDAKAE